MDSFSHGVGHDCSLREGAKALRRGVLSLRRFAPAPSSEGASELHGDKNPAVRTKMRTAGVLFYFSKYRIKMAAIWTRVALSCGTSLPSEPLMMPSLTAQHIAS